MSEELPHPAQANAGNFGRGSEPGWGQLAFVFLAISLLNALLMPNQLLPGDPDIWLAEAQSIVQRGELAVGPEFDHCGAPGQYFVRNSRNGHLYSKYGLASSLLMLPPVALNYAMHGDDRQQLFVTNLWYALGSGLLAALLVNLAAPFSRRRSTPLLFTVACLYGTFAWFYLRAQSMELPLMILLAAWFTAAMKLLNHRGGRWARTALWLMAGTMVMIRPVYIALLPLTLGVDIWPPRTDRRRLLQGAGAALATLLLLAIANHVRFGAWHLSGYHQWYPELHALRIGRLWHGIFFLTDLHYSVLLTFPPLLFSLFATRPFWRQHRAAYLLAMLIAIPFFFVFSTTDNWSGAASEGPRYLLPFLPLLALPFVLVIDRMAEIRSGLRRSAMAAVLLAALGFSSFNWFQVIERPMFAWTYLTSSYLLDAKTDFGWTTRLPRGLFFFSLQRYGKSLDEHPYMRAVAGRIPPDRYAQYRLLVMLLDQPNNWYLLKNRFF
jgi:hypothetical protein